MKNAAVEDGATGAIFDHGSTPQTKSFAAPLSWVREGLQYSTGRRLGVGFGDHAVGDLGTLVAGPIIGAAIGVVGLIVYHNRLSSGRRSSHRCAHRRSRGGAGCGRTPAISIMAVAIAVNSSAPIDVDIARVDVSGIYVGPLCAPGAGIPAQDVRIASTAPEAALTLSGIACKAAASRTLVTDTAGSAATSG